MQKTYTLYILLCGTGEFYTGITTDLEKRVQSHQLVNESWDYQKQWTRFRQPVQLVFSYAGLENYSVAVSVEKYIKQWKKSYKQNLINGDEFALNLLKKKHFGSLHAFSNQSPTQDISLHSAQTQYPCIVHTQK